MKTKRKPKVISGAERARRAGLVGIYVVCTPEERECIREKSKATRQSMVQYLLSKGLAG